MADDRLFRMVRMDGGVSRVRYGGRQMVVGMVRDVRSVNAHRLRVSVKLGSRAVYQPVELLIQVVHVESYTDVTNEFFKD